MWDGWWWGTSSPDQHRVDWSFCLLILRKVSGSKQWLYPYDDKASDMWQMWHVYNTLVMLYEYQCLQYCGHFDTASWKLDGPHWPTPRFKLAHVVHCHITLSSHLQVMVNYSSYLIVLILFISIINFDFNKLGVC